MEHGSAFFQAFIYLLAAVVSVPIAKRLGLGSVLGYLIAGAVIGPHLLGWVGAEGEEVMHVAEFGVVMMLFLVGLELRPSLLWRMRRMLAGLGGLQVAGTTLAIGALAFALGATGKQALAIGLIAAMSSTAIVLQTLAEKGQLRTEGGQAAFAVLLFQDIAVIPILALLPLLAAGNPAAGAAVAEHGVGALPGWAQTLAVLGAVVAVVLLGRFALRPIFRFIAASRLREIFTATALLLVVGVALLMTSVGLSPALGTFLAGVLLAESEYRHELESDIEPFKGLLLGLFFLSVGAGIDFALLAAEPGKILSWVAALLAVKFGVLLVAGKVFRQAPSQNLLFAFALAQGGEFAFVLLSFATQSAVLPAEIASPLVVTVALSMAAAPLLFLFNDAVVQPRFSKKRETPLPDAIEPGGAPVLIAGFGRFGHIVGRVLRANGLSTTVLEWDPEQVEALRKLGLQVFYGDASRLDLLHAAGAEKARLFVLATDDEEKGLAIVDQVKQHFPHLTILARAHGRAHAYELLRRGVEHVYRETLDSSLELSAQAMRLLGVRGYQARRAARLFRRYDEAALRELVEVWGNDALYTERAKRKIADLDEILGRDAAAGALQGKDNGWDTESLRREIAAGGKLDEA